MWGKSSHFARIIFATYSILVTPNAWAKIDPCEAGVLLKPAIVLVDPFGFRAGEDLPKVAQNLGFETIIVFSSKSLPPYLTQGAAANGTISPITHEGMDSSTLIKIQQALSAHDAKAVAILPGTESGVPLADYISEQMGLPTNGSAQTVSRRDKYEMHETLFRAGVRSARLFKSSKNENEIEVEFKEWAKANAPDFPDKAVIVKPAQSAGTDRVFTCRSFQEVQEAWRAIIGGTDTFGAVDKAAVAQRFLEGTEYIFDTISTSVRDSAGKMQTYHLPVGAWRYHRRPPTIPGRAPIIDFVEWIPSEELPEGMKEYAFQVLNAVGIKFGAAHLEIMMTPDGPVLVEVGARLPGGLPALVNEATLGMVNQPELLIQAYAQPEKFLGTYRRFNGTYPSSHDAYILFLSVEQTGEIIAPSKLKDINVRNFPTLSDIRIFAKDGVALQPTTDVTNALLRAHFVGSPAEIERDVRQLRKLHSLRYFYKR